MTNKVQEERKNKGCPKCGYLPKYGHRKWCPIGKKENRDLLKQEVKKNARR